MILLLELRPSVRRRAARLSSRRPGRSEPQARLRASATRYGERRAGTHAPCPSQGNRVWVPAFAGTTEERVRAHEKSPRRFPARASAHFPIVPKVYPNRVTYTSAKRGHLPQFATPPGFRSHLKALSFARCSSKNNIAGRAKSASAVSRL